MNATMTIQILGFAGTGLVVAAYFPQIRHIIKDHCSGAISMSAFLMWFSASLLFLGYAIMIGDLVFIILQSVNGAANGLILCYAKRYEKGTCPLHGKNPAAQ